MLEVIYTDLAELPKSRLMVLFGPPGSGKTTIGQRLEDEYDYHFYDIDTDFTPRIKLTLERGGSITPEMRHELLDISSDKIDGFLDSGLKIAFGNTFTNDSLRRTFLSRFPEANFILIKADRETRFQRVINRGAHYVPIEQCIIASDKFEPISIPYIELLNI